MGKADELSRRSNWEKGVEKDNEKRVLLKLEWLETRRIQAVEVMVEGVDILEKIRRSEAKDDKVINVMNRPSRYLTSHNG